MGTFLFQTSRTMPALFLWVTAVASVMFCCGPSARSPTRLSLLGIMSSTLGTTLATRSSSTSALMLVCCLMGDFLGRTSSYIDRR